MIDSDVMGELRDVPGHGGDGPQDNNSDDGFEEEEGNEVREIRLVPQDKTMCKWRLGNGATKLYLFYILRGSWLNFLYPSYMPLNQPQRDRFVAFLVVVCCIVTCSLVSLIRVTQVLEPFAFFWNFWGFGGLGLDFVCSWAPVLNFLVIFKGLSPMQPIEELKKN